MAEETPAKDLIEVYSESAAELDTEPDKPASETVAEPSFVCGCGDQLRSACEREPFYKKYEGKHYCVLHYPRKEKASDFEKAFQKKIAREVYDFRGVWFPDAVNLQGIEFKSKVDFSYATFSAEAHFSYATFSKGAYFRFATFSAEADFSEATFSAKAYFSAEAYFSEATFSAEAYFRFATFSAKADFRSATFSKGAHFSYATFSKGAYFREAKFLDEIKFSGKNSFGNQASLDLQSARIEKPERVSFHTVTLRPHWFVNVDPRKFVFTYVSWEWDFISIKDEIESLTKNGVSSPHPLLAIACQQLAENAEGNNRYEEASEFRYWSMNARRKENWRGYAIWKLSWWYWAVSGYGERILRAFAWVLAILILFALLYTKVGFTNPSAGDEPLPFKRAFTYSLAVMSLQKPEPRPLTNTAQTLVLLETILGPVQAALLALAIRRKFMR
ncbi:MAG: pentapeptide repeat-containing protein [Blastocatellia bacterium]